MIMKFTFFKCMIKKKLYFIMIYFYRLNQCFITSIHVFLFFSAHIDVYCCSNFDLNYIFLLSSLHLHLYEICFVKVFDSFIHVIILRTFKFIISVLFATHILPDFHREYYNFHCVYLV